MDRLSYLGDVLRAEGAQEAVTSMIRLAWKKFKEISNVICGKSMPLKVRGTLYKSYVRSDLTYCTECWALKVEDETKLKTTEIKMLRVIRGKTLKDKTNNKKIREMTGVGWGMWRESVRKRIPVKELHLEVDRTKKEGPRKRWKKVLECDVIARGLQKLDAQDRERWRLGCKNRMTPACREHLLGSRNRRKHIPGAK